MPQDNFYDSDDWIRLRYQALKRYGGMCQACGRSPPEVILHVDHIEPRSRFPDLALDITNLQVLCKQCNMGKGAGDRTDWRSARKPYIPRQNSKWTAFKKAMACCEFIRNNGLGTDAKWYVNNVMLPLIGMTRANVVERLSEDEALQCFRVALSGAYFYGTKSDGLVYIEYCSAQWELHLANSEHNGKTIGSLIWICQEAGMVLHWSKEVIWVEEFERQAKYFEDNNGVVKWVKDVPTVIRLLPDTNRSAEWLFD